MKRRAITIIVLILIMVSVLFCGCNKLVEVDEEMVELSVWHFTSGVANNLITVKHSDTNAIFEISVDKGNLWTTGARYLQTVTVNNGDTVRWHEFDQEWGYQYIELAYADIIVKVDDNIVGYAVVKITKVDNTLSYDAEIIKSSTFPKVDGQYQKVTQKQVEAKIKAAKK